jgi:hypothetical protein
MDGLMADKIRMNDQRSLTDQIETLCQLMSGDGIGNSIHEGLTIYALANREGLYDAADWVFANLDGHRMYNAITLQGMFAPRTR